MGGQGSLKILTLLTTFYTAGSGIHNGCAGGGGLIDRHSGVDHEYGS
jgi:hypothetical protein